MRRFERLIQKTELINEMLKMFDHCVISLFDDKYPYAVPVNYGYDVKNGKLFIYFHTVKEVGHKIALLKKNPNVCVTFSKFFNFYHHPYKKINIHDYRSVMAFGTISLMQKGTPEYGNALVKLLAQAGRKPHEMFPSRLPLIDFYVITCDLKDVYGKAESPIRTVEDVPFIDVYADDGTDQEPYNTTDLVSRKQTGNWNLEWIDE